MATAGARQGSCRTREAVSSRLQFLKSVLEGAPGLPAVSACGGTLGQIEGGSGSLTLLLDHTSSGVQPAGVRREFLYAALKPFRLCHFVNDDSILKASKIPSLT